MCRTVALGSEKIQEHIAGGDRFGRSILPLRAPPQGHLFREVRRKEGTATVESHRKVSCQPCLHVATVEEEPNRGGGAERTGRATRHRVGTHSSSEPGKPAGARGC